MASTQLPALHRGIARPDIRGTSLLNPIPVPANESFFMETEFGVRGEG